MEKDHIVKALQELRKTAPKRNFSQSVDLIFNLQDLDFKKPSDQIDFFVTLNNNIGKKLKVCGIVGPELADESKRVLDLTIEQLEFEKYEQNKKLIKKLARDYDYFIAQATIMPKIAQIFGRYLGPKNKMPNPKAGAVVPPKTNLQPLHDRLQKTIRITAKKTPILHLLVGKDTMDDNAIADNIFVIYDQVLHHLPKEKNNLKSVFVKFTMSKPIKL
jgi:large subunit ribosomal protein L1